jgi:hypothetical protein
LSKIRHPASRENDVSRTKNGHKSCARAESVLPTVQLCLQALDKLVDEAGGTVRFAVSLEAN